MTATPKRLAIADAKALEPGATNMTFVEGGFDVVVSAEDEIDVDTLDLRLDREREEAGAACV